MNGFTQLVWIRVNLSFVRVNPRWHFGMSFALCALLYIYIYIFFFLVRCFVCFVFSSILFSLYQLQRVPGVKNAVHARRAAEVAQVLFYL